MIMQNELAMVLQWMQVTFECYESIQMLYIEKKIWCVHGRINVCDVGAWLEKGNLGGGTLCDEGVTTEVSTGMGGRVILEGSLREKRPYVGIDYREIYYWIQTNLLWLMYDWASLIMSIRVCALVCLIIIGWYLDLHSMFWCSIMLSVVSRLVWYVW